MNIMESFATYNIKHELLRLGVMHEGDTLSKNGVRSAMRQLAKQQAECLGIGDDDFNESISSLRDGARVPDAWFIRGQSVYWIEVEDSNALGIDKMNWLCDTFWGLDGLHIAFHVLVSDRYGQSIREIPVSAWYAVSCLDREGGA